MQLHMAQSNNNYSSQGDDNSDVISILLPMAEITLSATILSRLKKSYDDWVWLWAEAELKLKNALLSPLSPGATCVQLHVEKINLAPDEEELNRLAKLNRSKRMNIQDILWFIAERNYILAKAATRK